MEKEKKREGPPQYSNWKSIERLCKFVVIFYNSTLVVSTYISLNAYRCYKEIVSIATNLIALSQSTDHELKERAVEMFKKFDNY